MLGAIQGIPLVLAVLGSVQAPAPSEKIAARCTWEEGELGDLLNGLRHPEDDGALELALRSAMRHERFHGWASPVDRIPVARQRGCLAHILDTVSFAATQLAPRAAEFRGQNERNGRTQQGIDLVVALVESLPANPTGSGFERMRVDAHRSSLEIQLGNMELRRSEWSAALEHFQRFRPTSTCGIGRASEVAINDHREARCLLELGRWDDLARLCNRASDDLAGVGDACFLEYLIEACERRGIENCSTAWPSMGSVSEDDWAVASSHIEILRMPASLAVEHLPELLERDRHHANDVQRIFLRAGRTDVDRCLRILDTPAPRRTPGETALESLA